MADGKPNSFAPHLFRYIQERYYGQNKQLNVSRRDGPESETIYPCCYRFDQNCRVLCGQMHWPQHGSSMGNQSEFKVVIKYLLRMCAAHRDKVIKSVLALLTYLPYQEIHH